MQREAQAAIDDVNERSSATVASDRAKVGQLEEVNYVANWRERLLKEQAEKIHADSEERLRKAESKSELNEESVSQLQAEILRYRRNEETLKNANFLLANKASKLADDAFEEGPDSRL